MNCFKSVAKTGNFGLTYRLDKNNLPKLLLKRPMNAHGGFIKRFLKVSNRLNSATISLIRFGL